MSIRHLKKIFLLLLFMFYLNLFGYSQIKNVLFLGNSYTSVNNLPQMLYNIAISTGDTINYDGNVPGGYTLKNHFTNITSIEKIKQGNWDYVILQEQSQLPAFPLFQVQTLVFPYAAKLDSIVNKYNICGETIFYMTWGRKNGDVENCPNWPPVCTYAGMDSLLNLRYRMMADSNKAIIAPVGAVWHFIRDNFPDIELYMADGSHPSLEGTFAAACSFYTAIFRKDPIFINYNPGISSIDADKIKKAVKYIVYDSLINWHIGEYDSKASFQYNINANEVSFTNTSIYADEYLWDFGDGTTSTETHPTHIYLLPNNYSVTLTAKKCDMQNVKTINLDMTFIYIKENSKINSWELYPNPAITHISIKYLPTTNLNYKIFNLQGLLIQSGELIKNNFINISNLSKGAYFLQLQHENKILGQKKFTK